MVALRKDSDKCKTCYFYNNCDEKRMVLCAISDNNPISKDTQENISEQLQEDILMKHDYRNVKVSEGMTITIYLEDVKKNIENDLYRQINCHFMNGA